MIVLPGYSTGYLTIKADTTIPVEARAVRNALSAKDSLELMKQERQLFITLKDQYEKLAVKDSSILQMYDMNTKLYDKLIANLEGQVKNQEKQTSNNDKIITEKDGIIKKKNRQIGFLGLVVLGLGYMLIKK